MKQLLLAIAILFTLSACGTAPDRSYETLEKSGYTAIEIGGYAPFACSEKDKYHTKFTAKNSQEQVVNGVVCCGWFKGCTVRF